MIIEAVPPRETRSSLRAGQRPMFRTLMRGRIGGGIGILGGGDDVRVEAGACGQCFWAYAVACVATLAISSGDFASVNAGLAPICSDSWFDKLVDFMAISPILSSGNFISPMLNWPSFSVVCPIGPVGAVAWLAAVSNV